VRRFTGSASLKYDPVPWLSNRFLIGTDYTMEDINVLLPYQTDSVIVFFLGSRFDGSRSETTQQTTYNTYDYAATAKYGVWRDVQAKSTLGVQYYTNKQTTLTASGQRFPAPGVTTITATGIKGAPTSNLVQNNTLGSYLQQEFAWSNRLFVTGAVRVDNNSAFGSEADFTTYPKISASWVASAMMTLAFLSAWIPSARPTSAIIKAALIFFTSSADLRARSGKNAPGLHVTFTLSLRSSSANPSGKVWETLTELIRFCASRCLITRACDRFRSPSRRSCRTHADQEMTLQWGACLRARSISRSFITM
jgi:hypothetical protein